MSRFLLAAILAVACGGTPPPQPAPKPVTPVTPPISEQPEESAVTEVKEDIHARANFPETPLTPLARQIISVTECALRGQPMPQVQFGIERPGDGPLVDGAKIPAGDLHFIAFALELEVALPNQKGLELMLVLTEHGVKILDLEPESVDDSHPLPRWLPIDGLISEILRDVGNGKIDRWLVGEPEKSLVGPEIAREIDKERPKPDEIAEAQKAVGKSTVASGYALDDIALVAKDGTGKIWAFKLQFEDGADPELDGRPLVRVRAPDADD